MVTFVIFVDDDVSAKVCCVHPTVLANIVSWLDDERELVSYEMFVFDVEEFQITQGILMYGSMTTAQEYIGHVSHVILSSVSDVELIK